MVCDKLGLSFTTVGGMCPIELFIIFSPVLIGTIVGFILNRYLEADIVKLAEFNVKIATEMQRELKQAFIDSLFSTGDKEAANEAAFAVWQSYANQYPENKLLQDYVYQVDTCKLYSRYKDKYK